MAEAELTIVIAAKNAARAAFQQAVGTVRQFGSELAKATGGSMQHTLSMVAQVSKLEIGMKAVSVATDIWRGELEKVPEQLRQLPLGLGQVSGALEQIILKWTGWGAEIDEANRKLVEAQRREQELAAVRRAGESSRSLTQQLQRELELEIAPEGSRKEITERHRFEQQMQQIAAVEKASLQHNAAEQQRAVARQIHEQKLAEIRAEQEKKLRDEQQKAAQELAQRQQAIECEAAEKRKEILTRELSLRQEIEVKSLELAGRGAEARVLAAEHETRERIAQAKSIREAESILQLHKLGIAEMLRPQQSDRLPEPLLVGQRFGNLAAMFRSDQARGELVELKAVRAAAEKTNAKLDVMIDAMRFAQNMPFWGISLDAI